MSGQGFKKQTHGNNKPTVDFFVEQLNLEKRKEVSAAGKVVLCVEANWDASFWLNVGMIALNFKRQ